MQNPVSNAPTHGRIVASAFVAAAGLHNPHLQTLAPQLRPLPPIDLRIERLDTPDGDFIDLGWAGATGDDAPIAILLHGLGGGFDSKYQRGLARRLASRGWRCVLLRFRGAGPESNRLPRSYHQGDTGDLRWLWQRLRRAAPTRLLVAVGWSMGGNILLRALAEEGSACPLDAAVAASVPFSLQACAEHLDQGFARIYQRHLLKDLKSIVQRKHAAATLPTGIDVDTALAARSFIAFDDAFTAPLNGFIDARDYYRRCASGSILGDIRTPTRIVQSLDDPFMPRAVVPTAEALSPAVTLELSEHGGHVGFLGRGTRGATHWWLESHVADHLEQVRHARAAG